MTTTNRSPRRQAALLTTTYHAERTHHPLRPASRDGVLYCQDCGLVCYREDGRPGGFVRPEVADE